jgi:hypothetical protein
VVWSVQGLLKIVRAAKVLKNKGSSCHPLYSRGGKVTTGDLGSYMSVKYSLGLPHLVSSQPLSGCRYLAHLGHCCHLVVVMEIEEATIAADHAYVIVCGTRLPQWHARPISSPYFAQGFHRARHDAPCITCHAYCTWWRGFPIVGTVRLPLTCSERIHAHPIILSLGWALREAPSGIGRHKVDKCPTSRSGVGMTLGPKFIWL